MMYRIKTVFKYYISLFGLLFARIAACFHNGSGIWLIAEKTDEARDNGYWFAKYMCNLFPDKKIYYVISEGSVDYQKIDALHTCKRIKPGSWKHKILFWSVQFNVMSQPPCDYFTGYRRLLRIRKKRQINVFLQHGIIKDALDHSFDSNKAGIDLFITSSERERQAVMSRHNYNENQCILTGLCRFDNLIKKHGQSNTILIMPTFRHWIMCAGKDRIPSDEEISKFKNDDFFRCYKSLLTSSKLHKLLDRYNYKVIFYPHYCAQPFLGVFEETINNKNIILASSKIFDVQNLLLEADILITDYSSVFFDFAYLKKPEIFFQFDAERYRGNHYKEGYFKYDKDAFGPVFSEGIVVIDYIEKLLKDRCTMENYYLNRVSSFFQYTDTNNCQRTYEAIVNYNTIKNRKVL